MDANEIVSHEFKDFLVYTFSEKITENSQFAQVCPKGYICERGTKGNFGEPSTTENTGISRLKTESNKQIAYTCKNTLCSLGTSSFDTNKKNSEQECPPGFYCQKGFDFPCEEGKFCPPGINYSQQLAIPENSYINEKKSDFICKAGFFRNQKGSPQNLSIHKCQICPTGYYCPEGAVIELNDIDDLSESNKNYYCPMGYFCPPGTKERPSGPQSEVEVYGSLDLRCPAGFYCGLRTKTQEDIPTEVRKDTDLNIQIYNAHICKEGFYCLPGSEVSKLEGNNNPDISSENSRAQKCSSESLCQSGSICPDGYYFTATEINSCIAADPEHYVDSNDKTKQIAWKTCSPGFGYQVGSATSDASCNECSDGTFSTGNKAVCVAPDAEYYVDSNDKTKQIAWKTCSPGFGYQVGSATSDASCNECSDGTFLQEIKLFV